MTKKYRIRKNSPFGSEGQIVSYNSQKKKWETDTGNVIEKKYLSYTEFFEEVVKESKRGRASIGEKYYFVDDFGDVVFSIECDSRADNYRYKTGNYFQAEEQAQAYLDLQLHVGEFEEPEKGDMYYWFDDKNWNKTIRGEYDAGIIDKAEFFAGTIMPLSSTEEDREKRKELLTKVYGK